MRDLVIGSFFGYVALFVIMQQIIGRMRVRPRPARSFRYPLFGPLLMISQAFLCMALIITIPHSNLDNLIPVRITGLVVVVLGLILSAWALYDLGRNWVGGISLYKDHRLVTDGIYRYVRHPLYAGMLVSAIGLCLVSLDVFYGLGCLFFSFSFALSAVREDMLLRERFKDRYEQYAASTGAIFPRLRRRRDGPAVQPPEMPAPDRPQPVVQQPAARRKKRRKRKKR